MLSSDVCLRGAGMTAEMGPKQASRSLIARIFVVSFALLAWFATVVQVFALPSKDRAESLASVTVLVPAGEADVLQAVEEVASDQIIHGTYVYEKEKTLTGAHKAAASSVFQHDQEPGKTFYKVAENVLDPRHFKASNDMGTITVRYIVQGAGSASTSLRIDAVFVETGRRRLDRSDGTVESAEYDAVNQRLQALQTKRAQAQGDERKFQEPPTENRVISEARAPEANTTERPDSSTKQLEQKVEHLRHQVEMRAKADGVPLKSAPFRNATTIQALPARTEVVILILTPFWYGVETQDRHHGWIRRSQLEPLP